MSKMSEDIAVIKSEVLALSRVMDEFKDDTKKFMTDTTKKIELLDGRSIATEQKVTNMTVFQSVFSVIIGAIASYIGMLKRL